MFSKGARISLFIFFLILIANSSNVNAQGKQPPIWWNETWNGLRVAQPANEMPKGKAPLAKPVRVNKVKINPKLDVSNSNTWLLSTGWELIEGYKTRVYEKSIFSADLDTKDWYNATVPGTILTTLVKQGVYPDPYYGLNNLAISDTLCRMDWWYRIGFDAPKEAVGKTATLRFDGINYMAEVYLNNVLLGVIRGAFIRAEFDVSNILKKDAKNILAVRLLPPNNPGVPHEQSMISGQGYNGGQLCLDGPTFISAEGWDWMPGIRDRNMGIWQPVSLIIRDKVRLVDPYVTTDLPLPDTSKADLTVYAKVKNTSKETISGVLKGKIRDTQISLEQKYSLQAGEAKTITLKAIINNPKLWWPNGYGKQDLYKLDLSLESNNIVSDKAEVRFGVREFSYELMVAKDKNTFKRVEYNPLVATSGGKQVLDVVNRLKNADSVFVPSIKKGADESSLKELAQDDPVGPYLVLKVNGSRVFARGGNWGMDDAMKNISREKLEPYFKLHQGENLNIIRNWTGESTEDIFYDLADEYGMLVWNDFWLTTENSNTDANDHDLFVRNATDVVRRYRNHPSIAIWCPRNEGFAPIELEVRLSAMCAAEDPSRMYHGQSRYLNMGDSGPWGYFEDLAYYYKTRAKGFNTEMGSYAIPTANSIKTFIAPEDQWPINDVWAYHDLHHTTQGFPLFMNAVNKFGTPTNLEDFVKKAHIVNYDNWRAMVEAWNSKMWADCTGLILWMSHPAWPSMIWQTYTWDYETPAAYFGTKKAATPLHLQLNLHDLNVVLINATREKQTDLTASLKYYDLNGKLLHSQHKDISVDANSKFECMIANTDMKLPNLYLARLSLFQDNKLIETNDYWRHGVQNTTKDFSELNNLKPAKIEYKIVPDIKEKGKYNIELKNSTKNIAVSIKLNAIDAAGKIILPAYFSDGYFNMLGGEVRNIQLELPEAKEFKVHILEY